MGSKRTLFIAVTAFFMIGISNRHYAVSPDQTNLAILIDENKINLKFINICVSNLAPPLEEGAAAPKTQTGTPTAAENAQSGQKPAGNAPAGQEELYKKLNGIDNYRAFKKANQADFNGNMWYFQSNYSLSYKNLKSAQAEMKDIFQVVHENYIKTARILLEAASPMIIRSNDKIAQHLLKLGFRDLKSSEDSFTSAYNSSPYQFRVKLVLFGEGIKVARRARRFAILAMIAAKTPNDDKAEFQFVNLDEVRNAAEKENISDYDRIRNTLIDYIDNELLSQKISPPGEGKDNPVDLLETHDDNYGFITNARVSFLEKSNEEIRSDDINKKEALPPVPQSGAGN